jgi:hypothetical protein
MTPDLDETKGEVNNDNLHHIFVHAGHRPVVFADVAVEKFSNALQVPAIDIG